MGGTDNAVSGMVCITADSVFGVELSKQFEPSDRTPAPRVLMRCTAELEKRIQETGIVEVLVMSKLMIILLETNWLEAPLQNSSTDHF